MFGWLLGRRKSRLNIPDPKDFGLISVHSFRTTIAGAGIDPKRSAEIGRLRVGDLVVLFREPDNQHDDNAIAVFSARAVMLGYIPATVAGGLASDLDDGENISARVVELRKPDGRFNHHNAVLEITFYEGAEDL